MALHKDKFEYISHKFSKHHTLLELSFVSELSRYPVSEDNSLEPVYQLRDLGVSVSGDLSWSPHIWSTADKPRQKAS